THKQLVDATNESNRLFLYCAFLNFSSGEGVWSSQGCALTEGNLTHSVCHCTHLTNFAILMQVVPLQLTHGHQVALSSISYVGCSLSVLCLAATLVTFAVLSSVSTIRNQRYHIHANLSFAVLVAQVLLLISFRVEPGTVPCQVLAVLLHYFFLSAFGWMLVEGLHLYSMVIKVFGSEDSKHLYYYGIGWGCPLLICIISMSFSMDSYGTSDSCWLSLGSGAIWAFVAPALLVIVVNIVILVAVTRVISHISTDNYKIHGDPSAFKLTAKAVAVLLPILGTSWVFGVLAVSDRALVFQYMFAVLNSLQGLFIFLFHCLLNSEVRAAFKHKTKVWSLTSSSARTTNTKPFSSDIHVCFLKLTCGDEYVTYGDHICVLLVTQMHHSCDWCPQAVPDSTPLSPNGVGLLVVVLTIVTLELTCFSGIHTVHGLVHAASSQASILAELVDQIKEVMPLDIKSLAQRLARSQDVRGMPQRGGTSFMVRQTQHIIITITGTLNNIIIIKTIIAITVNITNIIITTTMVTITTTTTTNTIIIITVNIINIIITIITVTIVIITTFIPTINTVTTITTITFAIITTAITTHSITR
ncbi:hypothetical protein STEG23_021221, partial [Scotinomys teguina]